MSLLNDDNGNTDRNDSVDVNMVMKLIMVVMMVIVTITVMVIMMINDCDHTDKLNSLLSPIKNQTTFQVVIPIKTALVITYI